MTDDRTKDSEELAALARIDDPAQRVRRATDLLEQIKGTIDEVSRVRRDALEELISTGLNQTEIAQKTGMTRARIGQLLTAGPRPERAFLGTGTIITIAVGGKDEAGRVDDQHGVMASREAVAAQVRLAELARSLGFQAEQEIVAPPGHVNLNRPGLIVLCSPRLLPFVGQVLDADPHLGFAVDDRGWYLVDRETGEQFRSPSDNGRSVDYAYVGRLPRPDGRGTFLYLAGVHSFGTEGAAHFVEANLQELWTEVRNRRFSQLIEVHFNRKTRAITETKALTPIHKHEGVG